ncbi:hypothetical protein Tco_0893625 [Tanacetum coccineum]|uniref:Uncharacterized protein n=1 Tax=Tanacetum coccineum TaxID=301880 RepID=A0ABQ5CC62_9ASTR
MARPLFNQIVTDVSNDDAFFLTNMNCAGRQAISGTLKCTYVIPQLAYGAHADFLDEYMQISERTSRTALDHFCQAIMEIYGPGFFKNPLILKNFIGITKKAWVSGMLGRLNYTYWEWFGCPYAFKAD